MPIPILNPTSNIQSRLQFEPFEFSLAASNFPAMWQIDGLPSGVVADPLPTGYACTGDAATDVITATGHNFAENDQIFLSDVTGGGAGIVANRVYWAKNVTTNTLRLAASLGGSTVDIASTISAGTIRKVMTGRVSGAATVAGTRTASFVAMNNDGVSTAVNVTFGIGLSAASTATAFDLEVDVQTGAVTVGGAAITEDAVPRVKEGDKRIFSVRLKKGESYIDPGTVGKMQFGVRENEDDPLVVLGGGAATGTDGTPMKVVGSGVNKTFLLAVNFTGDALTALLADLPKGQALLAELTWEETNGTSTPRVGDATLPITSRTFDWIIERQLVTT